MFITLQNYRQIYWCNVDLFIFFIYTFDLHMISLIHTRVRSMQRAI